MNWVVGLVDMQSFYASCETASRPEFAASRSLTDDSTDPTLVVAGDPERRSGIVLAATPPAKRAGISTAMRLGEALRRCPNLVVVRPRMAFYLRISAYINEMLCRMFPVCEPYSVDETFFAFPAPSELFPDPVAAARTLREVVWDCFRIRCRVGLADNKWMAKMANQAAKQNPSGVEWWKSTDVAAKLHPLPVDRMWGLKRRAEVLQRDFGAETIGDVARIPEAELMKRFGVWGTIIHRWSHGQDLSPVDPRAHDAPQKGFSQRITLPHDFCERSDIAVVVLELLDELCLRVRLSHHKGRRVGLGLTYADFEGGFYRTRTIPEATDDANDLYPHVLALLDRHWKGEPVRAVSVSLDLLEVNDGTVQMSLFENRAKKRQLTATLDRIRLRYGQTALMRAVSLLPAGQIRDRSRKIGGHYR